MKFFVKDFCETLQARIVNIVVVNDVLWDCCMYCGIVNQSYAAYSSRYLSDFLSFHTLNNEIFRRRFLWNPTS